jgi:hypothetical protein
MNGVGKSHVNVKADKLEISVLTVLEEFQQDAYKAVAVAIKETGDEVVRMLKSAGDFKGKKYRNSWTNTFEQRRLSATSIVHNKKHYRLTHLLEFGHAKQNGGRTRAFPHIEPINEMTGRLFEQKLKDLIGGIPRV